METKHSAICYVYQNGNFEARQLAKRVPNAYDLDLFQYGGKIYEGRTGLVFLHHAEDIAKIEGVIGQHGGISKLMEIIEENVKHNGLSPRYTRPEEKLKDIFPPKQKDENVTFSKDTLGKKHYYYRFFNEDGIELYTLKNQQEYFHTVFVSCNGFMVGIDQRNRLEEILKWLSTLEDGIYGEIERRFSETLKNPKQWADVGFANVLGRAEEAKTHNAPILEARQQESAQRTAEKVAAALREQRETEQRYTDAIRQAETDILAGKPVLNSTINDKSLIMQLFREHEILVPLKTQGWIINALHSVQFDPEQDKWQYRYYKKNSDSTKMSELLPMLSAAVQTKAQFAENSEPANDPPTQPPDDEQDLEH